MKNINNVLRTTLVGVSAMGCVGLGFYSDWRSVVALTYSEESVKETLSTVCGSGSADSSLQTDCQALSEATPDEQQEALAQITPAAAAVPISPSLNRTQAAQTALAARLSALRGGARGFSLGFNDLRGSIGGSAGADTGFSKFGGFLNVSLARIEQDTTELEPGYDSDGWNLVAGLDYRMARKTILGGGLSYTSKDTTFNADQGNLNSDSWNLLLYGTHQLTDSAYLEGTLGYGWNDYSQDRRIRYTLGAEQVDQTAFSDFSGNQSLAGIGAGMDMGSGAFTFGPEIRLQYVKLNVDGYAEKVSRPGDPGAGWAIRTQDQEFKSLTTSLGATLAYSFSQSWGVLSPYTNISWVHEFEDESVVVQGSFVGDSSGTQFSITSAEPDKDYYEFGIGASAAFKNGASAFLGFDTMLDYDNLTAYKLSFGFRKEF